MSNKKKRRYSAAPVPAVWTPDPSTPLFVSCSACGFRVETLRAVETGWTSTEHVGLKYKFCPECGKPMMLKSAVQSLP